MPDTSLASTSTSGASTGPDLALPPSGTRAFGGRDLARLAVHGSWMPARGDHPARFVVWGESAIGHKLPPRRGRKPTPSLSRPLPHPFAATLDQLHEALALAYAEADAPRPEDVSLVVRLPSVAGAPSPSPDLAVDPDSSRAAPPALAAWEAGGLALTPVHALEFLLSLDDPLLDDGAERGEYHAHAVTLDVTIGEDLRFWTLVARVSLELLYRQRFAPTLEKAGDLYFARWRPLLDDEADRRRHRDLAEALPPIARALAWTADAPEPAPGDLITSFLEAVTDAIAREAAPAELVPPAPRQKGRSRAAAPPSPGEAWLAALSGDPALRGDQRELAAFYREYQTWAAAARSTAADSFRVCFRLDPPEVEGDAPQVATADGAPWRLSYLLQASDDPSLLVPASAVWQVASETAIFLNRRLESPQERLLAGLGRASRLFSPIETSLRMPRPDGFTLTSQEAFDFVKEKALLLQAGGFGVLVPGLQAKLGLRIRLGRSTSTRASAAGASVLSWDSLVAYDWQVALGDQTLTREEFETLARLKQPLVCVRGQWVELRPEQLEQALAFFERQGKGGELDLSEALRLVLAPDHDAGLPIVEVSADGDFANLLREIETGEGRESVGEPPGFVGTLRPYQKVGVSWLSALRRHGLGACLADDMGLGKTPELIALLLHGKARQGAHAPALVICPTSVVGNWRRELERFAPSLRVLVHHGATRSRGSGDEFASLASRHDVVLSTYALLPRDEEELASVEWSEVVLDEAQNVKNASTKAAQVARRLPAKWRATLTGTPVENRLAELWSLFQFLNPGYLGSEKEFRRQFVLPIERARDVTATNRLKKLVRPFILRRVKTDRSIIDDLPEKHEMKVYCTLTREQATLYEATLKESLREIEESEGIRRRGQILATLTKLKQVCDHPALLLHDQSELTGRSGKLARLTEMLEEVLAVRDRALIFTQYAEMGGLLAEHLEGAFGREVLFLHGGVPAAERDRMVARFQAGGRGPDLFVLSLKAGGTGLNLTQANHVFHFDRWWNPAVENQATDRAFRIGQRRDVQVHKFLCVGTFEEALDKLIEAKLELADSVVSAGESWITEMSSVELRDLLTLRESAVAGEGV